jgi:rod shape-determining protein MreD
MRWLPFLILAYFFVSVQFALGGILRLGEYTPNLVLLLVIFIGLHAPLDAALLAGFTLGFMHDIISSHGIGTYALAYSLICALAVQLRGIMYADHFATHFTITLMLGGMLILYLLFRHWMRSFFFADEVAITFWSQATAMLVTAFLALPVIYLLRKMRRTFHFSNK